MFIIIIFLGKLIFDKVISFSLIPGVTLVECTDSNNNVIAVRNKIIFS